MRQMRVALLRPLLSLRRSSLSTDGRGRVPQPSAFQGRDSLFCREHSRLRWLSTLRAAELDDGVTSKTPRQPLPDIQRAPSVHQFEHEYEAILLQPAWRVLRSVHRDSRRLLVCCGKYCGISTCSVEDLVFISDSLHDRIIVTDANGGVLDYIGSSAGFEDGPFESASLCRPSSVVYDSEQKCLYIADCENHAIRRANFSSRMLDTVHPKQEEERGRVQRWLSGLWFMQNSSPVMNSNRPQISYPWHLSLVPGGNIMTATQEFEKLWMIEVDTGAVTIEADQEPATNFKMLSELKSSEFEDWIQVRELLARKGLVLLPSLVSQAAVLKSEVLVVDTGMHQVFRLDLSTGHVATMQLTNLARLGFPPWWSSDDGQQVASSLERLHQDRREEALTSFNVQPGRCTICVDVALPSGTILAEPLTVDSLWRQGRGSLVELSTFDGELWNHKVTAAQQFVDDLYNLEVAIDKEMEDPSQDIPAPEQSTSGLRFYSFIDTSLGTGEVVFDAVLYLKRDNSASTDTQSSVPYNIDSYIGHGTKATAPSCQMLKDGFVVAKHLHFRVRCEVSADAPRTSMLLVHVQL